MHWWSGSGTGGTLIGVGQAFRKVNPDVKLFGVEPDESCMLLCGEIGRHLIEGISDGFVPGIFERYGHTIDGVIPVESAGAIGEMRRLAREYGISSGLRAGRTWRPRAGSGKSIPGSRTS